MKNTGGKSQGSKKAADVKKDRKSGTGMSGSPKKGGHGGKYTWSGGDGSYRAEIGNQMDVLDARDPNFEDPEPEEIPSV